MLVWHFAKVELYTIHFANTNPHALRTWEKVEFTAAMQILPSGLSWGETQQGFPSCRYQHEYAIKNIQKQIKLLTPNLISARNSTLSLLNKYQSFIVFFFLLVKFIFHTCVFQKIVLLLCVPKQYKLNRCLCI
jgi:hypothetical protein